MGCNIEIIAGVNAHSLDWQGAVGDLEFGQKVSLGIEFLNAAVAVPAVDQLVVAA
jgi:hypothetical protein